MCYWRDGGKKEQLEGSDVQATSSKILSSIVGHFYFYGGISLVALERAERVRGTPFSNAVEI